MENLKANIKKITVQLVGLEKRKKSQKSTPWHVLKMYGEVKGKLDGIFLALSFTLSEEEYKALRDWYYNWKKEIEVDYSKGNFDWKY